MPVHAGCRERWADGTCVLDPGAELTVVSERLSWRSDAGEVVARAPELTSEGELRTRLVVPAGARLLVGRNARGPVHVLPVRTQAEAPWLGRTRELKRSGRLDEAERLLDAQHSEEPGNRTRAAWQRARLAIARDDIETARTWLARTADEADAAGIPSLAVDASTTLAYVEIELAHEPTRAAEALERAMARVGDDAERGAEIAYYAGLVERNRGNLRAALPHFDQASRAAERLGLSAVLGYVEAAHATCLTLLGRYEEALARERGLLARAEGGSACELADLTASVGFTAMVAARATDEPEARARYDLEAERQLARSARHAASCSDAIPARNAQVNLALHALSRGDASTAAAALSRARTVPAGSSYTEAWELEVEGRLALLAGDPAAARRAASRQLVLSRLAGDQEGLWRSWVTLGQAHEAAGDLDQAEQAFIEAERILDGLALAVALGTGRGTFLDGRGASAFGLVRVQLARGETRLAHATARSAMGRDERFSTIPQRVPAVAPLLATYRAERDRLSREARDDWRLSNEELQRAEQKRARRNAEAQGLLDRALAMTGESAAWLDTAPGQGTLRITFFAGEGGGWVFAETESEVRVVALPWRDLSAALAPFAGAIAHARRIELRATGTLAGAPLHTIEVSGRPLFSYAPVVYPVDVAHGGGVFDGAGALVVADPTGALPHARAEGRSVAAQLRRGADVTLLEGRLASRAAVLGLLERSGFVHFAGHGKRGEGTLDQHIVLADGVLSLSDVLALARAPRHVVLSACEAGGAATGTSFVRSLGLGQAFVARGADQVVAPVSSVDDAATEQFMTRLIAAYDVHHELAEALRAAQLSLMSEQDESWKSFRVWTHN